MTELDELLPCPFCGGDVHFSEDPHAHIICFNQGCDLLDITFVGSFNDFASLAKAWNTRTESRQAKALDTVSYCPHTCVGELILLDGR